jgi:hypothetical protein
VSGYKNYEPNPSGAPGILCRSEVEANTVATGMTRTSPRCLNPNMTEVIATSIRTRVINPARDVDIIILILKEEPYISQ